MLCVGALGKSRIDGGLRDLPQRDHARRGVHSRFADFPVLPFLPVFPALCHRRMPVPLGVPLRKQVQYAKYKIHPHRPQDLQA